MKVEIRIFKNAVVMILQPLFLNLISLFIIGYIARKLGVNDFGIFNLALLFATLFYPLGIMGLNSVSIRDISKLRDDKKKIEEYIGRLLNLRLAFFFTAVLLIIFLATIMNYPPRVTWAIYFSALLVGIQLFSEAVCDIFTAFERMEYTALISLISGFTLTILSVLVLYRGYGLFEVLGVYSVGHLTGSFVAIYVLKKRFLKLKFRMDFLFWKEKIIQGLPFITMSLAWAGIVRFDTIILSKVVSAEELGLYTTGMLLVTKISLIPEAVGGSIYPAVSSLFGAGRLEEIGDVAKKTFSFMTAIALPICIGGTLFGGEIVKLIFGATYQKAGWIFAVAIWSLFLRCFMFIEFSILAAMHKQNKTLRAYAVTFGACLALNISLTYPLKTEGALIAFMCSQIILLTLFTIAILKELPGCLQFMKGNKILYLNLGLIFFLVLAKSLNFIVVMIFSGIVYLCGAYALEIITTAQMKQLKKIYGK